MRQFIVEILFSEKKMLYILAFFMDHQSITVNTQFVTFFADGSPEILYGPRLRSTDLILPRAPTARPSGHNVVSRMIIVNEVLLISIFTMFLCP